MYLKDSILYWKKNISKFFFIFLAVVIGMSAIIVSALLVRSQKISELEDVLTWFGNCDFIFYNVGEDEKEAFAAMENADRIEEILTFGTAHAGQVEFPIGALGSEEAGDMLHLAMLEGRYPQEPGEITMDRITMLEMGLLPETGQKVSISFGEEGSRTEREYLVVGVIEQQYIDDWSGNLSCKRMYEDEYLEGGAEGITVIKAPFAYVHRDEAGQMPERGGSILMVNASPDKEGSEDGFISEFLEYLERAQDTEIKEDGNYKQRRSEIARTLLGRKGDEGWYPPRSYQEALSQIGGEDTEKDVYSRVLIPLFAALIAAATFFSLFEAVSSVFVAREQQMGVYRCLGMSRGQAACKALAELLAAVIPAVLAGCLFGTLLYELVLAVAGRVFGMGLPQAFGMEPFYEPFLKAATAPPYLSAIVPVAAALSAVAAVFMARNFRLPPLASSRRKRHRLRRDRLNQALLGANVVLLAVVVTAAFLYFKGESEMETASASDMLQTLFYGQSDYMMDKDEGKCGVGVNEDRHDAGIPEEDIRALSQNPDVESLHAVIECYGTNLVYGQGMEADWEALEPASMNKEAMVSYGDDPVEFDLFEEGWGYSRTDRKYKAPTVAASAGDLAGFSDCLASGGIDLDAINAGKEVLVAVDEGAEAPFAVGDELPMDMLIYPEEVDESETRMMAGGAMPGVEPTYPETEEHRALYVYGERKGWTVKVGGIVRLDAERANFFRTEKMAQYYPDWDILTTTEGLAAWELPAVNYTKLVVKLREDADTEEFERLWFSLMSKGKLMNTKSVNGLNAKIATVYQKNRTIFLAMAFMMMAASMVGILNAVHMRVLSQKRRDAVMRALGQEGRKGVWNVLKGLALMALCGCAAAEAMVAVLGHFSRIVYDVEVAWGNGGEQPADDWWGFSFPIHGNLWEWENYLPAIAAGLAIFLVAGAVAYFTYKKAVGKDSIAASMREE